LQHFDGSLVLAAALQCRGVPMPPNGSTTYGDPRLSTVDPVVWVELIPFEETRQYVRRVLGNYLVYRARMGDRDMTLIRRCAKSRDSGRLPFCRCAPAVFDVHGFRDG